MLVLGLRIAQIRLPCRIEIQSMNDPFFIPSYIESPRSPLSYIKNSQSRPKNNMVSKAHIGFRFMASCSFSTINGFLTKAIPKRNSETTLICKEYLFLKQCKSPHAYNSPKTLVSMDLIQMRNARNIFL